MADDPERISSALSREVEALQVAELFRNLPVGASSAFFGTLLCTAVFLHEGLAGPQIAWLTYGTMVAALRLGLWWLHGRRATFAPNLEPWQWARLAVLGNVLAGIQWGLLGTWLYPDEPGYRQTFAIMVITSFVGGSVTAYAAVRWAHPALSIPATLPSAVYIFFIESGPHYMAGFTALFFSVMVLHYAFRETEMIAQRLRADVRLRRHLQDLESVVDPASGPVPADGAVPSRGADAEGG